MTIHYFFRRALGPTLASALFFSALQANDEGKQDIYDSATLMFNSQEYELALDEYLAIVEKQESEQIDAKAAFYAAETLFRLGQYPKASQRFKDYLIRFPKHDLRPSAQYRFAEALYLEQVYEKAAAAYQRFIADNPDDDLTPKALYSAAGALMELGRGSEAQKLLSTLSEKFPNHQQAQDAKYFLAWTHFKNKNFDLAAQTFLGFAKTNPNSPKTIESILRAADALYSAEDFQRSLDLYNRVLAEGQGAFKQDCHVGIAWSYYKLEEFEKAGNFFATLARNSDDTKAKAEYYYQCLRSYYDGGKFQLGLSIGKEMLTASNGAEVGGDAQYWLGIFYQKLQQPIKAAEHLDLAAKAPLQRISLGTVLLALGNLRQQSGDPEKALTTFSRALETDLDANTAAQVRYEMSRVLHQLGRTDEALALVEKNLSPNSSNKEGLTTLSEFSSGEFKYARKDYRGALEHFLKVLQEEKAEPSVRYDALYRVAWCHRHLDNPSKAIEQFQELEKRSPAYRQEARFLIAEIHSDLLQAEQAQKWYLAATQLDGDFGDRSSLALGQHFFDQSQFAKANEALQALLAKYPSTKLKPRALFLLAEVHYHLKNQAKSKNYYDLAIASSANEILENALYGRAWLNFEQKNFEPALSDLDQLLKQFPESPFKNSALQLKGQIYVQTNRLDLAKDVFKAGLDGQKAEGEEALLMKLANVESELKNFEKALEHYDTLLQRYPNSDLQSRVFFEKGWLYMELGKTNEALLMFKAYQENWPKGDSIDDVSFALGELYYEKEQYAQAAMSYAKCLQSDRYLDKALYKLGFGNLRTENFETAATWFSKLSQQAPESILATEARYREGQSWLKAGQFEKAASALARFIEKGKNDPLYADGLHNLGKVYEKLEKDDDAINVYENHVKLFPKAKNNFDVAFALGQLLIKKGRHQEARHFFNHILEDPTHYLAIETQYRLGSSFLSEQRYRDAVRAFFQIFKYEDQGAWAPMAWLQIARCQVGLDKKEKAISYLQKVMDDFPGTPQASEALELLKQLDKS